MPKPLALLFPAEIPGCRCCSGACEADVLVSVCTCSLALAITDTLISRWGHDTLEDKEERKRQAQAKGVIAWTDPDGALQEKKEFVWSPQRIEDEANNAIEGWLISLILISC